MNPIIIVIIGAVLLVVAIILLHQFRKYSMLNEYIGENKKEEEKIESKHEEIKKILPQPEKEQSDNDLFDLLIKYLKENK